MEFIMRTTLKYKLGTDTRLRRLITYRDLLSVQYRIKVFPARLKLLNSQQEVKKTWQQ